MGLFIGSEAGLIFRIRKATYWHFAAALILAAYIAGAFGDVARDFLMYDRGAIESGELWRLLTGHLVHLSLSHLHLNMLGLALTWMLIGGHYTVPEWLIVTATSLVTQSLGFWFIDVDMLWYVGMSGLLHGLMIAGAIRGLQRFRTESIILCVLVVAKLVYEQLIGPLPGSESSSGGNVMVNAHLYGAVGGTLAALSLWRRGRGKASI
jgi:rhomboid family GlyGly-CTERM serine protease